MGDVVKFVGTEPKSDIHRALMLMKAAPILAEALLDILAEVAEYADVEGGNLEDGPRPNLAMRVQTFAAVALGKAEVER